MNQHDIRAFLTIARTGSLNQAANILFITQPALSQQLKALEAELGTTLFNRKKGQRTLSLTTSGRQFFAIAKKYNALYTESMQLKHMEEMLSLSVNAARNFQLSSLDIHPLYREKLYFVRAREIYFSWSLEYDSWHNRWVECL